VQTPQATSPEKPSAGHPARRIPWGRLAWTAIGLAAANMLLLPVALNSFRYPLNWVLLGVCGLAAAAELWRHRASWRRWLAPDFWATGLFLAWVALDFSVQGFRAGDSLTFRGLLFALAMYLLVRALTVTAGPATPARPLLVLLACLGVVQALLGMAQYYRPDWLPAAFAPPAIKDVTFRIVGTLENSNQYGAFLALVIPLAAGLAWGAFGPSLRARLPALGGLAILLAALVLTFSRGAQLSLTLGLILAGGIWALARRRAWLTLGCIAALTGLCGLAGLFLVRYRDGYFDLAFRGFARAHLEAVFAGNAQPNRTARLYFDHDRNGDLDARDYLFAAHLEEQYTLRLTALYHTPRTAWADRWRDRYNWNRLLLDDAMAPRVLLAAACFQFWRDDPVWGIGPGNFLEGLQRYVDCPDFAPSVIYHAHSLPLQWLAELGLPGLLMFLSIVAWTGARLHRRIREGRAGPWLFFLAWSLLTFLTHQLVDITLWYLPFRYVVPVLFAIWAGGSEDAPAAGAAA